MTALSKLWHTLGRAVSARGRSRGPRGGCGHAGVDYYYLGHHKCATNWMRAFIRPVCELAFYNYQARQGDRSSDILDPDRPHTFFIYVNATPAVLASVPDHALGFHLIRDPRDVLVSDYFSRKHSHRAGSPGKQVLRDYLLSHGLEDGLLHMLDHCNYFKQIRDWPLGERSNILTVRYEDMLADEQGTFRRILEHLALEIGERELTRIRKACSFKRLSGGRERGEEDQTHHFRKGVAGDWVNYLVPGSAIREAFYARYGDLTEKLGYEP